jgi:hypothetical protein
VKVSVKHEFMQQFAEANGFHYAKTGTIYGLDGWVFTIGHGQEVLDLVTGTYEGYPISLFTYSYNIGQGKNQQKITFDVFELQFDTAIPDFFLLQNGRDFGSFFMGKEKLKLEGDFDRYFTLSIAKGYEVEALEVFTPEVMAALIDKARSFSLEIVNDHVFIYATNPLGTKEGLYAMYGFVQYFTETLGPVLARMKSSLVADKAAGL